MSRESELPKKVYDWIEAHKPKSDQQSPQWPMSDFVVLVMVKFLVINLVLVPRCPADFEKTDEAIEQKLFVVTQLTGGQGALYSFASEDSFLFQRILFLKTCSNQFKLEIKIHYLIQAALCCQFWPNSKTGSSKTQNLTSQKWCFSLCTDFFASINYIVKDIEKRFSHNKQKHNGQNGAQRACELCPEPSVAADQPNEISQCLTTW